MRNYCLFIAMAIFAVMAVSCKNKNTKKVEKQEASQDVVEAAKTILADDVLSYLDALAQVYIDESKQLDFPKMLASYLTDEEKLVKPDYLLNPYTTNNLITKTQKVGALAILSVERHIRKIYDIPVEKCDEAIGHLIADLNHPLSIEHIEDMEPSEKVKEIYRVCKERGEVAYFWKFFFSIQIEFSYIIAQNPDMFFRNITQEQWSAFHTRKAKCIAAIQELAKYDTESAAILERYEKSLNGTKIEDLESIYSTIEGAKQHYIKKKQMISFRRTSLLSAFSK